MSQLAERSLCFEVASSFKTQTSLVNLMHSYGQIQPETGRVNELFSNPEISWMHLMQLGVHSYGQIQPETGRVNELFSNPEISWMHLMQLGVHSYGQIQPEAGRVGVK